MKYQPPYGVSDPNAGYQNGNPATGTPGSIPPAASIEYPQREIVSLITGAAITPADTDLQQLLKAVRNGKVIYGVDSGQPGSLMVTFNPPLDAYTAGMNFHIKVANSCPGPSNFNTGTLGPCPIVNPDGTPLTAYSWPANAVINIVHDGTNFQLVAVAATASKLFAPATFYVNAGIGSDTAYDGTSATIVASTKHGPFATVQRAITEAQKYNQNGYTVTINIALGTYPAFICTSLNGSGNIVINGDTTTPSNVLIHATAGEAIYVLADGYTIQGVKMQSDAAGTPGHWGAGLRISGGVGVNIQNVDFGACQGVHLLADAAGFCQILGANSGQPAAFYKVSGDSPIHLYAYSSGVIVVSSPLLQVPASRSIGIWAEVGASSSINVTYQSQTITGTVTGQKYSAVLNGVINTFGGGINYLPGSVAGGTATGGQYA